MLIVCPDGLSGDADDALIESQCATSATSWLFSYHGADLSDFLATFVSDSPVGSGAGAGVWLSWHRLPQ